MPSGLKLRFPGLVDAFGHLACVSLLFVGELIEFFFHALVRNAGC